jgi:uncharacterized protein YbjT (DUF2867 family)
MDREGGTHEGVRRRATGVIGTEFVPQPAAAGHDVIGMTRSPAKADMLRAVGARPVVADALDPDAVARAATRIATPASGTGSPTTLQGESS